MRILLNLLIFVGLCFAAIDIPEHLRKPLIHARKACLAESGVDVIYVNQTKNGYVPDVPELGCYINCLLDHFGMKTEDGAIIWDKVMHLLTPDMRETVAYVSEVCGTKRGQNACETALLTFRCFFETAPEGSELP